MAKLKPCPNCKSKKLSVWRISPPRGRWFRVECDECYWCGETKLFKFRAIRAWNKDSNKLIAGLWPVSIPLNIVVFAVAGVERLMDMIRAYQDRRRANDG